MNNISEYQRFLTEKDTRLGQIILSLGAINLEKRSKVYLQLCSSILSQQLSVKVARVIYGRFLDLYNGKEPELEQILQTGKEQLRAIGFSRPKSEYIHNVCNFFAEHQLTDTVFYDMKDEEVIQLLTQIKGIGRWTVEMILIFTLARRDVFPLDDLGVRNAMIDLYKIKETNKKDLDKKLIKISKKWAPYRSYATRYLWAWKDAGGL